MDNSLLPGDNVCDADGFIRGHGTLIVDNMITSTYFGRMKQINKLVTVEPHFSFKYTPEIGDVVIGRVTGIYNKRWKLDTNCKSDTTLSLSAINLPGVMQRRKSEEDEMNMREFFDLNDLVVCEVQKVNKSGSAALHTRNDRYRKLEGGVLVTVPPYLLAPLKTRFIKKCDIEVICGCNGYIWITSLKNDSQAYRRVATLYKTLKDLSNSQAVIELENVIQSVL